ncbi:MAG: NAD(P)-binding domain-containing protein [Methanomicrobium sp.]|nr:NAD(P)-binding domain-containing protein [Methanomicrobium sp.]
MKTVGIIGTGHIGSLLAKKLIETAIVGPQELFAANRTPEKLNKLAKDLGITPCKDNIGVAKASDIIFVCVRPAEAKAVIAEIKPTLTPQKLIISTVSDVKLADLKAWSGIDCVRIIPSVTSEYDRGVMVISFPDGIGDAVKESVMRLFEIFSLPYVTAEENISSLSDLTSSSPAIIAAVIQEFAKAAAEKSNGGIPLCDAEELIRETLFGTAVLLDKLSQRSDVQSGKTADLKSPEYPVESPFDVLIDSVATNGGITAEGVLAVREKAPELYDKVLTNMQNKHKKVGQSLKN